MKPLGACMAGLLSVVLLGLLGCASPPPPTAPAAQMKIPKGLPGGAGAPQSQSRPAGNPAGARPAPYR
jgi:hypothetical protein